MVAERAQPVAYKPVKSRWEDYLTPQSTGPLQPRLSMSGVIALDPGLDGADAPPQPAESPGAASAPTPAPSPPAAVMTGPFEVPDMTPAAVRPERVSRFKLAAIVLFGALWAGLELAPPPRPAQMDRARTVAAVPARGYARYAPWALDGVPVHWMVRMDRSLIVKVESGWEKLPVETRQKALRRFKALGENPAEVLVVGPQSELLAEVYEDRYHLYR